MSGFPKKGHVYVVDDDEGRFVFVQMAAEGKDYSVRCFDSRWSFSLAL